ncbi:MAG: hypothetical protein RBS73_16805 [Prolixibacteraceae bacterium]|jgi:exopolyphosphatase/guanosine-5'-triphosphate,3'-diphosphate pyrophosphatase|nr:hypothetical protein [Prolixibacteraceae bacterium]
MSRIAVIDLGTNTCNLLIAEYHDHRYEILYQGKEAVKMGRGGIHKNRIMEDGMQRAVQSLLKHQQKITHFNADKVIAIATSAVRDAGNRDEFCRTLLAETGIPLQVISGKREAELIFNGVLLAFDGEPGHSLIMDIGGGSNEFILCREKQIIWKESFPLGIARILEQFPLSDPATNTEAETIRNYFNENMGPLWNTVSQEKPDFLIGCSGAFDTLVDLLDGTEPGTKLRKQQEICPDDFRKIYEQLIRSTTDERMQMKGLEPLRMEMIVPAVILIDLVLEKTGIHRIVQTDYALREGVLYELI